ncbi:MAG: hypothetical protein HC907_05570 [Richelia sp. SM1_7_0]|nr:hypothetical protein [Richelia sp. SM1_7_0]
MIRSVALGLFVRYFTWLKSKIKPIFWYFFGDNRNFSVGKLVCDRFSSNIVNGRARRTQKPITQPIT